MSDPTYVRDLLYVRDLFVLGAYEAGKVSPLESAAFFDRWLAAHDVEVYQRGREDAADFARNEMKRHNDQGEWLSVKDKDVLAAARGESDHE